MDLKSKDYDITDNKLSSSTHYNPSRNLYQSTIQRDIKSGIPPKMTQIYVANKLTEGIYTLKIHQTLINVKTNIPLEVGKTFSAPVLFENGKFKIFINSDKPKFQNECYKAFLLKHGIPVDSLSEFILSFITNLGGRITPDKIVKARSFKKLTDKDNYEPVESALFLEEAGIISSEESVLEVLNFTGEEQGQSFKKPEKKHSYKESKDNPNSGYQTDGKNTAKSFWGQSLERDYINDLHDETLSEIKKLEDQPSNSYGLLTILNHLNGKDITSRYIPFEIKSLKLRGIIIYLFDSHSKKIKEVHIKANLIKSTKIVFKWHFRIIPSKNNHCCPEQTESPKKALSPIQSSVPESSPDSQFKALSPDQNSFTTQPLQHYKLFISTLPELNESEKAEIVDFFKKNDKLRFSPEFKDNIWNKNKVQNDENIDKIDIQV